MQCMEDYDRLVKEKALQLDMRTQLTQQKSQKISPVRYAL